MRIGCLFYFLERTVNRVEHYLTKLMKEPGKWIRISKLKHQRPSAENTAERMQVMKQIMCALDLMDVRYEAKSNTHFTIKVLPDPKAVGIQMHVDLAKKMVTDTTVMYSYRMSGKKAQLVIMDDIYKKHP